MIKVLEVTNIIEGGYFIVDSVNHDRVYSVQWLASLLEMGEMSLHSCMYN